MGKDKPSVLDGLRFLLDQGVDVHAVVAPAHERTPSLASAAKEAGVPVRTADELHDEIQDPGLDVDLVISFLNWKRIREPLIRAPRLGCINLHPAPLPDFRGVGGYNIAIYESLPTWGVSAHFVDEDFDTGDLVEVERFPVDPARETAFSLDLRSQERLLELFRRVVGRALAGEELPREPQGPGRYVTREELEALRVVRPGDDLDRKLRAFWYPPYPGAVVEVDGRELTLVNEDLLADAARAYRISGLVP